MNTNPSTAPIIERNNARIFRLMSVFLNLAPDFVTREMIDGITGGGDYGTEYAFAALAASACGVDSYDNPADKQFFRDYFLPMIRQENPADYENDPYLCDVCLPEGKRGAWTFENRVCKPFEAFVRDDPVCLPDGRVIPQIGFFPRAYRYPAVLENGREWMTLMPNEINTHRAVVADCHGHVLTYGLGLGYFTYLAALRPEVESVTAVELRPDAIALFRDTLLPQMKCRDKIRVVQADAFDFAASRMAEERYDVVFTDLWHDPSDGVELYQKMKTFESRLPDAKFYYWIENTLKLYM